jgi:hypothetical protein
MKDDQMIMDFSQKIEFAKRFHFELIKGLVKPFLVYAAQKNADDRHEKALMSLALRIYDFDDYSLCYKSFFDDAKKVLKSARYYYHEQKQNIPYQLDDIVSLLEHSSLTLKTDARQSLFYLNRTGCLQRVRSNYIQCLANSIGFLGDCVPIDKDIHQSVFHQYEKEKGNIQNLTGIGFFRARLAISSQGVAGFMLADEIGVCLAGEVIYCASTKPDIYVPSFWVREYEEGQEDIKAAVNDILCRAGHSQ